MRLFMEKLKPEGERHLQRGRAASASSKARGERARKTSPRPSYRRATDGRFSLKRMTRTTMRTSTRTRARAREQKEQRPPAALPSRRSPAGFEPAASPRVRVAAGPTMDGKSPSPTGRMVVLLTPVCAQNAGGLGFEVSALFRRVNA